MATRVDPGPITASLSGTDFRLIASTATIGTVTTEVSAATVTQAGTWDIRLIASTATIGTTTVSVNAATVTQGGPFDIRLIASTPTIGAVTQAGGWDVRLIAGTATAGSVTVINTTVTAVGTVTVSQGGNSWNVGQSGGWDVRLIAGTATVGTVTLAAAVTTTGVVGTVTVVQGGNTWTVQQGSAPWSVSQSGGYDVRLIASTPTIGTATVAQGGNAWNVGQTGGWDVRLIASTATIGTVTATVNVGDVRLIASTATVGTVTVIQNPNTGAFPAYLLASTPTIGGVTQGGAFDVRLIASTPTLGVVQINQVAARLLAGTATAATVTAPIPRSRVVTAPTVVSVGIFASPTLAANTSRKSMWFHNVGTTALYLAYDATPTSVSYHFPLASGTQPHNGTGTILFDNEWQGGVYVISSAATGTVCFAETT